MNQIIQRILYFFVFTLMGSGSYVSGEITIIASAGDASPDGNGIYTAAGFNGNTLVDLNENGQLAFTARLTATSGGSSDDRAIIRADRSSQEVIARKGDRVDALSAIISDLEAAPDLNNNGELAFRVGLEKDGSGSFSSAVLRWTEAGLTAIVEQGDPIEDSNFGWLYYTIGDSLALSVVLSDSGEVAFYNSLENSIPFLGSGDGNSIDLMFFNRFSDGDFPVSYSSGSSFSNRVGQASLRTALDTGTSFLLLESTEEGSASFQAVAQAGDVTPDGLGTFSIFAPTGAPDDIPLNNSGEMVFEARVEGAVDTFEALFAGSPGAVREIAREDTIPDGSDLEIERFRFADIDEDGRVAFMVTAGSSDAQLWLERPDFSGIDLILEEDQEIGTGDWTVGDIGEFVLNNSNQLAINVQLNSVTQGNRLAVLFYDANSDVLRPVAIQGDALDGSTLSQVWFTHRGIQGRRALNDEGELVFLYQLANGVSGIAMWEPGQPYGLLELDQVGEGSVTLDSRFELVEEPLYRVPNPSGETFELSASPATGYAFSGWSGDFVSSEPSTSITLDAFETLEVTANFDLMAPEITSQSPSEQELVVGETLVLQVEASGVDLDFDWVLANRFGRIDGSVVITDSSNGSTLEIESVDARDTGTYYARVSNAAGSVESVRMEVAVVDPIAAPEITSESPAQQELVVGDTLRLQVEASGTDLDFEWVTGRPDDASVVVTESSNGSTLEIESVDSSHVGTYYVRVSNSAGSVESERFEVSVVEPITAPEITSQSPSRQELVVGDTLVLQVQASGTDLEFEWVTGRPDDASVVVTESSNGSTLEIESVDSSHAGTYYVRVSNPAGSVESVRMEVAVVDPTPNTWYSGASDLGGDWRFLPWLRSFNVSQEPWIFHPQHGWLYPFGDDPATGMFFWDARQASFLYTTSNLYPTMYRFSDNKWIRYQIGSRNPRWFVDLQTGIWESLD